MYTNIDGTRRPQSVPTILTETVGQTKVVRLLLLYGANANAKANGFYTPLHIAASMDNVDCVVELLNHNADITSKDEFGKTAYETAIMHKCKKSARILKSEG